MSFVKSFGMSFFSGFLNFPQNGTCQNNKGNIADATCQEIIDMIGIKNLGRYVVFNTISIGKSSDMLKKIAEMTGGKYVMAN